MTTEQKELLIKDLCAKLPYGVKDPTKVGSNIKVSLEDWLNKNHFDYRGLIVIEMGSKKVIKEKLLLLIKKLIFFLHN